MLKIYEFFYADPTASTILYDNDTGYMLVAGKNKRDAVKVVSQYNKESDDKYSFTRKISNLYHKGKVAKIIIQW